MQRITSNNDLFSPDNIKCVEVNNFPLNGTQNSFISAVEEARNTLSCLERSLHKSSKYEQKLVQCKNTHSHSHDTHKWWDSDQSEQKSFIHTNTSPSISSRSGVGRAESWSTMSIACLQYQYDELSKRYEALLQAYDDQCSSISYRDMRLAQWRQRANLTQAQLSHAHQALLSVGEKYLALRRKRNALKQRCDERVNRMKSTLHDVVEITAREQLRFDARLSYCMSNEKNSDAALLLHEVRKCNLLFLENMRLKTIIEEFLPGHVNWKKC
ncbi:uncharacterized protein LOC142978106 [Anticarsia gemmatalis]|uniref:uncharacterized protein LOC142978106 n=1 Tax=Anticarsia gemmatalis TaxID=129554 RepID=UPI003F76711D